MVGVAAGAAVALLYAPQTGEKTRRQLRRNLEDAGDYIKDAADTVSDHAEEYVKRGRGCGGRRRLSLKRRDRREESCPDLIVVFREAAPATIWCGLSYQTEVISYLVTLETGLRYQGKVPLAKL